jgi:hypothetical protein
MLQSCTKFYQTASKTNHQLNNNSRQWPGGLREALSAPRPGGLREALSINHLVELMRLCMDMYEHVYNSAFVFFFT